MKFIYILILIMSSSNINITAKNIAGKCDLKCSYNFKYSESSSTAKNNGSLINLTYDSKSVPPVIHNSQKYTVGSITITSPSIHVFNDNIMSGEMMVTHNPVNGGNILQVCVPFITSTDSSRASQTITEIISLVATNAPSNGDTTNLNIPSFNLQNIIPSKPFFFYSQDNVDWIVYGAIEAIPLSSKTINTLHQIIKPFPIPTPGGELFYNSTGPTSGQDLGNGIYISCQPTGSSNDETAVEYDKAPSSTTIDFSNMFQNETFKTIMLILISSIVFIAIFYGLIMVYNKYKDPKQLIDTSLTTIHNPSKIINKLI